MQKEQVTLHKGDPTMHLPSNDVIVADNVAVVVVVMVFIIEM